MHPLYIFTMFVIYNCTSSAIINTNWISVLKIFTGVGLYHIVQTGTLLM